MPKKDRILRDAVILTLPQIFNLLFKVFMVNFLKVDYSRLGSFIAMLGIVATPLSALTAWASHRSSHYVVSGDAGGMRRFTGSSLRVFALVGLAAGAIVLVLGLLLRGAVAPEDPVITEIFAACVIFVVLSPLFNGLLQGRQRYGWMALYWLVFGGSKLLFGMAFFAAGLAVVGGILGILSAYVIGAAFAVFALTRFNHAAPVQTAPAAKPPEIAYLGLSAVALSAISIMFFSDEVMVRLLIKAQADVFSSAKNVGLVLIYAPVPFIAAMFPKVTERHLRGESTVPLLWKCLGLAAGVCLLAMAGWWFAASTSVAKLLMGESNYVGAGALSRLYCLAVTPYALVNVLAQFSIARGRWRFLAVLVPAAMIHLVLLYAFRMSIWSVITAIGVFGIIVVASMLFVELTGKRVVQHHA
jgi:O-antigen/teichoic acid export membrane protein